MNLIIRFLEHEQHWIISAWKSHTHHESLAPKASNYFCANRPDVVEGISHELGTSYPLQLHQFWQNIRQRGKFL